MFTAVVPLLAMQRLAVEKKGGKDFSFCRFPLLFTLTFFVYSTLFFIIIYVSKLFQFRNPLHLFAFSNYIGKQTWGGSLNG
jgi:hypothetical protein